MTNTSDGPVTLQGFVYAATAGKVYAALAGITSQKAASVDTLVNPDETASVTGVFHLPFGTALTSVFIAPKPARDQAVASADVNLVAVSPTQTTSTTASPPGGSVSDFGPAKVGYSTLQRLEGTLGHAVYWAGARGQTAWELTVLKGQVYIRYVPTGEAAGTRTEYLTVGTYDKPSAYTSLRQAAGAAGATSETLAGGALVVQPAGKPTSAYFAFYDVELLMEVYDPIPGRAYSLVNSGAVQPLPTQ